MSLKAQVDVAELLRRIEAALCEPCKKEMRKVTVPLTQTLTVEELLPKT